MKLKTKAKLLRYSSVGLVGGVFIILVIVVEPVISASAASDFFGSLVGANILLLVLIISGLFAGAASNFLLNGRRDQNPSMFKLFSLNLRRLSSIRPIPRPQ